MSEKAGLTSKPKFGEWLRGIYASESNPQRDGMYVRTIRRTGRMNPGTFYEMTDGNGRFWQYPAQSVERVEAPQPPAEAQRCTCPSGDGSLRWPCPAHPPEAQAQGGGDGLGEGGRYWRERAEFWRAQAVALGWRERRDSENGDTEPPSAPVGVEDADLVTRLDAIHQRVFGKPYPTEALAQQPATETDPAPCPVCLGFCGDSGPTCSERMEVRA